MLHLYLSNRPEALVATLAGQMRADPLPLLETEHIVVPSTAVSRWLGIALSDHLGVAGQIAYPFPAAFAWSLFGRVLPGVATQNPFDRAAMHWRLLRLVGASMSGEVIHYLEDDDGTRANELAGRLAELFDRYLVERPDWISAWSNGQRCGLGRDEGWQADLWRALLGELHGVAHEHPRESFLKTLEAFPILRKRLPRRITLFAVEAMPALYWDVFAGLAKWIELHVHVLSPCREYWGDVERRRTQLRMELENPATGHLYENGHPLLASLGRARQSAVVRLAETAAQQACQEAAIFVSPPQTLLGKLQRDMLELGETGNCELDDSVQVHGCHGPMREAEVLHDCLLALFERLPDLKPSDILILTPDIETYGPLVEAVLLHAPEGRRIPCAVADRPASQTQLWLALRRLCSVAAGGLAAEEVMSLLDEPAMRRSFDLDANDLPLLRDWLRESGIRWAEDGRARARQGLPAEEEHTWRAGLRRLLLGMALPDHPEQGFGGVLPAGGIEGNRADLLGNLLDFSNALFALSRKVGGGGTAAEWVELLNGVIESFFLPDETEETEAQRLRNALAELAATSHAAECVTSMPLTAFLREVERSVVERAPASAFASGKATIASLQADRPLPARVICLVGLNDGLWPHPAMPPAFDLMARYPRIGDRNRRAEDRFSLLEAIVCARDVVVVTYTGSDARSDADLPPAAPLAELIDVLVSMTGKKASEVVVRHPLQPFNPAYFEDLGGLFSFNAECCPPVGAKKNSPFITGANLAEPVELPGIELGEFQRFFANSTRSFMFERLGIHLDAGRELLENHEPFVVDGLDAYRLREACFDMLKEGGNCDDAEVLLSGRGWLPHGTPGRLVCRTAFDEASRLWEAVRPWAEAPSLPACGVNYRSRCGHLVGQLDGLTKDGLWRVRHGRLRARDHLRLWIDHLLLLCMAPEGIAPRSTLVALDGKSRFGPADDASRILDDLLILYGQGIRAPLPFYPETAWAWLDKKSAWRAAWEGSSFQNRPGERDDPYLQLALRDHPGDPLGTEFQLLAERILSPLRAALLEVGDE